MALQCPQCKHTTSLRIVQRVELPRDSRSDEITLQVVRCGSCQFEGIAVYEESRRGALHREIVQHWGYRLPSNELSSLEKKMRTCPRPHNPCCTCPAHRALSTRTAHGRWNLLDSLHLGEAFLMVR